MVLALLDGAMADGLPSSAYLNGEQLVFEEMPGFPCGAVLFRR